MMMFYLSENEPLVLVKLCDLFIGDPIVPRLVGKRFKRASAGFVELAVELDVLESCAVYERAKRVDRDVESRNNFV